jgi:hypothetical protein
MAARKPRQLKRENCRRRQVAVDNAVKRLVYDKHLPALTAWVTVA